MTSDNDSDNTEMADRATLAHLERWLPRVSPPADTFDRILAEIQPEATVIPLRPKAHRRHGVAAVATLSAVAAVIVIAIVAGGNGLGPPDARAAIAGKSDPAVTGEARLYGSTAAGGTVKVTLRDVPPAASGHHYEVWVLRRNSGGQMEAIGSFTPTSHTVKLDLPLPGAGDYAAVDISVEQDGGSPQHSNTSLASGAFS
jgi:anti-sigma-K factor RskA